MFLISKLFGYVAALTVADAVFSTLQALSFIMRDIPSEESSALGVVASNLNTGAAGFLLQWPIILLFSFLPFLVAVFIQHAIRAVSTIFFLTAGALIGGICSGIAYLLFFRLGYDSADGVEASLYFTHSGIAAVVSGIVGAYVYRRIALIE